MARRIRGEVWFRSANVQVVCGCASFLKTANEGPLSVMGRRKGKDDDLDAISAARADLHGRRATIPKSKDGAVEALRVLRVARAQAVRERRNALQLLMTIVSAPEEVRDQVRHLTRMQLIRTLAAWRSDASGEAGSAGTEVDSGGAWPDARSKTTAGGTYSHAWRRLDGESHDRSNRRRLHV
jgi:hypothetical protein